jgi:hypothetical protein
MSNGRLSNEGTGSVFPLQFVKHVDVAFAKTGF